MNWSQEQTDAIEAVLRWKNGPDPRLFRLFGCAGTGKTTLAQEIATRVGGQVLYAAYTGKAASVLRAKGCVGASTIHKLIYTPADKDTSEVQRAEARIDARLAELGNPDPEPDDDSVLSGLREALEDAKKEAKQPRFTLNLDNSELTGADMLIVDEVSMVDERIGHDLLLFDVPILVLGDPAQLPPVKGAGYFINGQPDFLLQQIHRQCEDSPIIDLATTVRTGGQLLNGTYGESLVMPWGDPRTGELAQHADQILVGKNVTRRGINARMRQLYGMDAVPTPIRGDKVICLRNDHDLGIMNGSLWVVMESATAEFGRVPMTLRPWDDFDNDNRQVQVSAHEAYFLGKEPEFYEMREAQHFDFGYAITVHKSQGSQWDHVMLFDESACFRQDAQKHLYTGITRAAKKVTVVQR